MNRSFSPTTISLLAALMLAASPPFLAAQEGQPIGDPAPPVASESPEETIARIRERLVQEPDNATGQLSLGTLLLQQGQIDEARKHLQKAVELAPTSVEAHATLAVVLEQQNELEAAEQQFSEALKILPDNVDIRVRRAALRNRLNQSQGALEDLEHALRIDPANIQSIFGKGILLESMGRTDEAIQTMRTVEQRTTEPQARAQAHLQIGKWMGTAGRTDEAITELQKALAIQPDKEPAQLALANLAADSGRYSEAAEQFTKVVASSPDNQPARFGLAVALLMTERYPEALAAIEANISQFPNNIAMQHVLARLLAASPDDSVRDGDRALLLAAEVVQAHPGLQSAQTYAMALAETGRFEEAAAAQRELIKRFEESGGDDRVVIFRHRLELYEQGKPVRSPWLDTQKGPGF